MQASRSSADAVR